MAKEHPGLRDEAAKNDARLHELTTTARSGRDPRGSAVDPKLTHGGGGGDPFLEPRRKRPGS